MNSEPRAGQRVTWNSHGGEAHGKVVGKVTRREKISAHTVAASADNPEFIVETDEGKRAAHKPGALKPE